MAGASIDDWGIDYHQEIAEEMAIKIKNDIDNEILTTVSIAESGDILRVDGAGELTLWHQPTYHAALVLEQDDNTEEQLIKLFDLDNEEIVRINTSTGEINFKPSIDDAAKETWRALSRAFPQAFQLETKPDVDLSKTEEDRYNRAMRLLEQ